VVHAGGCIGPCWPIVSSLIRTSCLTPSAIFEIPETSTGVTVCHPAPERWARRQHLAGLHALPSRKKKTKWTVGAEPVGDPDEEDDP